MKLELHDGSPLNGLGLHVFDAGDIQKVILVVVREISLHLKGVHSPERLGDVNGGYAE
jgi:hypothetical protein